MMLPEHMLHLHRQRPMSLQIRRRLKWFNQQQRLQAGWHPRQRLRVRTSILIIIKCRKVYRRESVGWLRCLEYRFVNVIVRIYVGILAVNASIERSSNTSLTEAYIPLSGLTNLICRYLPALSLLISTWYQLHIRSQLHTLPGRGYRQLRRFHIIRVPGVWLKSSICCGATIRQRVWVSDLQVCRLHRRSIWFPNQSVWDANRCMYPSPAALCWQSGWIYILSYLPSVWC